MLRGEFHYTEKELPNSAYVLSFTFIYTHLIVRTVLFSLALVFKLDFLRFYS